MLALKLVVVPTFLALVSLAARRWGPGFAGWLAGLPVVAGPILVFIALERGAAFASDAACARPLPSMQALRTPRPELRSIVTDPPLFPPLASPGGPQDATPTAV